MTASVVTLTTFADKTFPAGTAFGRYHITFSEAGGATAPDPIDLPEGILTGDVDLSPGVWTATIQAFDTTGAPMADPFQTNAYTVEAPAPVTVTINLATGATLGPAAS